MTVRVLPAGDRALLVETADLDAALALAAELGADRRPEVEDLVPAMRTVLVRLAPGADLAGIGSWVVDLASSSGSTGRGSAAEEAPLEIPVRYDGPDLADVSAATGLSEAEVVAAHTGTPWRAAFVGFAPGFAYLTGGDPRLAVPRRSESRTAVPAGSVALADGFSAVYPRRSPGGWQLIGRTDAPLWDVSAEPPAAIRPGRAVRFVATDRPLANANANANDDANDNAAAAGSQAAAAEARAIATLDVLRPGPLALIQDGGRPGHAADGVGRSGAADRASLGRANRLVGNRPGAAAIECTLGGLTVRAGADLVVALAGAPAPAEVDGRPVDHAIRLDLPAGVMLRLRAPRSGLRTYLAVAGGIDVPPVLGSRSTDTLSGVGPRPLAAGDVLPIGTRSAAGDVDAAEADRATRVGPVTLHAMPGPRGDWFDNAGDLETGEWVVSADSNRVGLRLDRADGGSPGLRRRDAAELPSEGLPLGAIQVPPGGRPVLFLADHPVTGGYPVVAVVLDADVDAAAQLRPGQRVRVELVG